MQQFRSFAVDVGDRLETIEQQLSRMQALEYQLPKLQQMEQQLSKLSKKMLQVELNMDMSSFVQELGHRAATMPEKHGGAVKQERPEEPEAKERSETEEAVTLLALAVC
jgi:hypothetical protein